MDEEGYGQENTPFEIDPEQHLEWVERYVRRFLREFDISQQEKDELVGVGYLGVVEAAERFDPSRGVPFEPYARIRVRGALLDGLSKITGLSRSGFKKAKALRALTEYREEDEIRRRAEGSPEEKLAEVFQQAASAALVYRLSLCAESGEELLGSELETPEEVASRQEISALLKSGVGELPEKERLVIEEYYFHHKTFDEIGEQHSMSKGWISKIHRKAVIQLRDFMSAHDTECSG
ncbi:MAG: sigma-70 family RNA polymerase sigma factor [Bdellovibrionota bacterium]|jgi:RNA polymerase sigma factor for flagellar operon FliA